MHGEGTCATFGADWTANSLTERDQHVVDFDPVFGRELFPQGELSLLRSLCGDVSPAVDNSMHMGVDADAGLIVSKGDDEIGGFPPHPLQFHDFIDFVRHAALIFLDEGP